MTNNEFKAIETIVQIHLNKMRSKCHFIYHEFFSHIVGIFLVFISQHGNIGREKSIQWACQHV